MTWFHNFTRIERTVYKADYQVQTISSVLSITPALYRLWHTYNVIGH